jgi:hypothetical protein
MKKLKIILYAMSGAVCLTTVYLSALSVANEFIPDMVASMKELTDRELMEITYATSWMSFLFIFLIPLWLYFVWMGVNLIGKSVDIALEKKVEKK